MFLTHNSELRTESDPDAIATLTRKGWVEAPQPEFDSGTQFCEWVSGSWVVSAKPAPTYDDVLSGGYLDAPTGIKLKARQEDQTRYTSLVTLLSLGMSQGAVTGATIQTIFDYSETERQLPVSTLLPLMLRYGSWCAKQYIDLAP